MPSSLNHTIQTRTSEVRLDENGIIYANLFPGADLTLTDAVESINATCALAAGIKHPVLVNFGQIKSLSREDRVYFAGKETAKFTLALAIVTNTHVGRVIGNFMIGLNKTPYPTRIFNSVDEAVSWLKGFMK